MHCDIFIEIIKCLHIIAVDNLEKVINLKNYVTFIKDLWIMLSYLKVVMQKKHFFAPFFFF